MSLEIKALRTKYGLSQQELSDETGIPRDRIASWELKRGKPKQEDEKKLVKFFTEKGEIFITEDVAPSKSLDNLIEQSRKVVAEAFSPENIKGLNEEDIERINTFQKALVGLVNTLKKEDK